MFRLVPSMRPIEEIDCGLWPTPVHTDHKNQFTVRKGRSANGEYLRIAVKAMWGTPTRHNARENAYPAEFTRKTMSLNAEAAVATGTPTSGPLDPTAKPGALNPAFVCWLMGFPPEWDACAPTAMPSSRSLRRKS